MEIIFATQNKHKITEISSVLGKEFHIISLEDIGCLEELPETQDTFEGNAKQKAFYIYEHYHKNCFADDSGLEIEALNGKPGIYSARYAGNDKDMEANIDKVLYEMKDVTNRKAQFRTVIALVIGENDYETCSSLAGLLLRKDEGQMVSVMTRFLFQMDLKLPLRKCLWRQRIKSVIVPLLSGN